MKKLSTFDLVMIIVFVVVALLGGAAWWYLSGMLHDTQGQVANAQSDFDKYSSRQVFLPTANNVKTLKENIALMQGQIDPLVQSRLQEPGNKLAKVEKEDTVAWKHDLDAEVARLNAAAKVHGVTVPNNFYYGFSRYLNQNPNDEQTVVLSKQLLGVEEMANVFINAPVRSISTFRRTYEEETSGGSLGPSGAHSDNDVLPGKAVTAPGDTYIAYPFEIEFESDTASFRKVIAGLDQSPYVFVIRSIALQNSNLKSPQISYLDTLAANPNGAPVADTTPGAVGTDKSSLGPQFLFGNETLHIKMRVDMIEWEGISKGATETPARTARGSRRNQ